MKHLTFDLHVHTNHSHDGRDSVEEIVRSAIAKKLDGIAICDHNTLAGAHAARAYVADNHLDLIILPGMEVSTSKGHVLVLGLAEGIDRGLPPEEMIRVARRKERDQNTPVVIIAPHPYHPFRHSIGDNCMQPGVDAIEIYNSRYFSGVANKLAGIKAAGKNITAVAGSDAHSAEFVGFATVEVEVNADKAQKPEQEATLQSIKEGRVRLKACTRTPFCTYFWQMCKKNR